MDEYNITDQEKPSCTNVNLVLLVLETFLQFLLNNFTNFFGPQQYRLRWSLKQIQKNTLGPVNYTHHHATRIILIVFIYS